MNWTDRLKPETIKWITLGLLTLTAVALFAELAEDIWLKEGFGWDAPIMLTIHRLSVPWLDWLMKKVSATAGSRIVLPLAAAAVFYLWRKEWAVSLAIVLGYGGVMQLSSILKQLFARPRPSVFPPLALESSFSFPSGHTMSAVAFYGLLSLLLWRHHQRIWAVLPGLWVLLVAFSRVYLGVHYPSDVLASLAVGTIYLAALYLLFEQVEKRSRKAAG